jgi:Domain of unknown function (DUF4365)
LNAIAAQAGFLCTRPEHDFDSVDVLVEARGHLTADSLVRSPKLGVQLKATATIRDSSLSLTYDLPIKNYNDLRQTDYGDTPRLLVLLELPENREEWVSLTAESLILRRSLY